ncbi:MAG: hypothetical protein R2695_00980 [Acidimicrobiales bacterium]
MILHSSDFKLDLTPVDGRRTDLSRSALAHDPGIRLLLADSTNADSPGASRSEKEVGAVLTSVLRGEEGRRVIVASFASHIHRLQQVADAAVATDRVLVTLGLSMRRNVKLAREVGILRIPDHAIRDIEDIDGSRPGPHLCRLHGSQGERRAHPDGARREPLAEARPGRHGDLQLPPHPRQRGGCRLGAQRSRPAQRKVIHSAVDVHTSGHGKQQELRPCTRWRSPSGSSPYTASTRISSPIATSRSGWGWPATAWCCARTATRSSWDPTV